MNAVMERWVRTLRAELLDRTLIWNAAHLRRVLRIYERHYNQHRPHRALAGAAPLREPSLNCSNRTRSSTWTYAGATDSAESFASTTMLPDLQGQGFRHPQVAVPAARPSRSRTCTASGFSRFPPYIALIAAAISAAGSGHGWGCTDTMNSVLRPGQDNTAAAHDPGHAEAPSTTRRN